MNTPFFHVGLKNSFMVLLFSYYLFPVTFLALYHPLLEVLDEQLLHALLTLP